MEIEMKAKLNDSQLSKLYKNYLEPFPKSCAFLVKRDTYFSLLGAKVEKPVTIIRLREEESYKADKLLKSLASLRSFVVTTDSENLKSSVVLTIKKKSTDSSGIETNEETECELAGDQLNSVKKLLQVMNYEPYFLKEKVAYSFYIQENMHAELEIVRDEDHSSGIYLEIESIVNDNPEEITAAQNKIKDFFRYHLDISEFDGRSWTEILK